MIPFAFVNGSDREPGPDGNLVIESGQTVSLLVGDVKIYTSIHIKAGGELRLNGVVGESSTTGGWVEIECLNECIIEGKITGRSGFENQPTHAGGTFTKTSSLGFGTLSYTILNNKLGGTGGNGGGASSSSGLGLAGTVNAGGGGGGGRANAMIGYSAVATSYLVFTNGGIGGNGSHNYGGSVGLGFYRGGRGGDPSGSGSTRGAGGGGGGGGYKGAHGLGLLLVARKGIIGNLSNISCGGSAGYTGGGGGQRDGTQASGAKGGGGGGGGPGGSGGRVVIYKKGTVVGIPVITGGAGGAGGSGRQDGVNGTAGQAGNAGSYAIYDL